MCFVAVFVAHTQYTNLGPRRSKPVRTERIRAPYSPYNGSHAHLQAALTGKRRRGRSPRRARRFSAGRGIRRLVRCGVELAGRASVFTDPKCDAKLRRASVRGPRRSIEALLPLVRQRKARQERLRSNAWKKFDRVARVLFRSGDDDMHRGAEPSVLTIKARRRTALYE
jgi:hypothetical protein